MSRPLFRRAPSPLSHRCSYNPGPCRYSCFSIFFLAFFLFSSIHQVESFALALNKQRGITQEVFKSTVLTAPYPRFLQEVSLSATDSSLSNMECNANAKEAFCNKTVLLTGASGGLGQVFAHQLAACHVQTLVLSARKLDSLKAIAQKCQCIHPHIKTHCIPCDLSDPESVGALIQQTLAACPTIDVLINNGGVSSRSRFVDTESSVDKQVMQINFLSGAALAKAVVPSMIQQQSGRIVWISSVQGLVGIPNRSSYAASKFAVQGYCESIRAELKSSGVSVHCVSPGYIRTNLSMSAITGDGTKHGKMDETTASGSDPNEVAVTILNQVASEHVDFVVAATFSAKAAIWLRLLCPALLRSLLVKRYEKSLKEKED